MLVPEMCPSAGPCLLIVVAVSVCVGGEGVRLLLSYTVEKPQCLSDVRHGQ